jgi:hypothetical protein
VSQWSYVLAGYLVTLAGAGALLLANWIAMRDAERP